MSDELKSGKWFWLSWYSREKMGEWELYFPWWVTGKLSNEALIVEAAIPTDTEEQAKEIIYNCYDIDPGNICWRFCDEMTVTQSPFDEAHKREDWMRW